MAHTRLVHIVLAYPGTCDEIYPDACSNMTVVQESNNPDPEDIVKRTASAVEYIETIKNTCESNSGDILFIFPWFMELRDQLAEKGYTFVTILPRTSKSQDWFMRLVDMGYGFNAAASTLYGFSETIHYKENSAHERVYRLDTDMDLEFKDVLTLVRGERMRILTLRILLRDMLPYPEFMMYWFFTSIGFFIGFVDHKEALTICITTLAYTFGINYISKSYIMRRRELKRHEKK